MLENDLKKCSRCALCQEVCPLYKMTGNECSVSRGKIIQLLGVIKKDLKYTKKIEKNLNFCLNCSKCRTYCPSDIDCTKIFAHAKYEHLNLFSRILSSEFVFKLKTFLFFRIYKKERETLHFFGCISPFKNDFQCCALPYLTKGRLDIYEKLMKKNAEIIKSEDVKKVIFNCATCFDSVKNYPILNENDKKKLVFEPNLKLPNKKFTYHAPCHLSSFEFEKISEKLAQNKNYVPLENDTCCGFGGDFFLSHPIVSTKLSIKKAKEIEKTGAKCALTSCPMCQFSLIYGKIAYKISKLLAKSND